MPTEQSEWEILPGSPQEAESTIKLVEAGSAGSPGARRRLIHPLAATFPIVTYLRNPDRTINFDQVPLHPPAAELVRTLGSTLAFVTPNQLGDVVVTEIWEGGRKASMETSFFRRLYELAINPPAPADPEAFVQWAPADRATAIYNVQIVGLRAGGQNLQLDVRDVAADQLLPLDSVPTGVMDKTVELDLLLISEV